MNTCSIKGVDCCVKANLNTSNYKYVREIAESELYKALYARYTKSLDKMETEMSEEQFKMVLDHERILQDLKTYLITETIKKFKLETEKSLNAFSVL